MGGLESAMLVGNLLEDRCCTPTQRLALGISLPRWLSAEMRIDRSPVCWGIVARMVRRRFLVLQARRDRLASIPPVALMVGGGAK